jgi:hypothetical protein
MTKCIKFFLVTKAFGACQLPVLIYAANDKAVPLWPVGKR